MTRLNPYWGADFWEFLGQFFHRMSQWVSGQIGIAQLASDEIQVIVLSLIGISSVLTGSFLVLKRMTMLANALSHTILLGIIIAYVGAQAVFPEGGPSLSLPLLLLASLVTACLTALLTQGLTQGMRLQEDASIGLVFTTLFALGIVFATCFTRSSHIGIEAVMGNADALHWHDLKLAFWIAGINALLIGVLFKEFKFVTFDAGFARSVGISVSIFNYLFMMMTATTAVSAFRAVGVLLLLAFLVAPVLTARLYTSRLKPMIGLGVAIVVVASLLAVGLSRHLLSVYQLPLSTAGLLVVLLGLIYFGSLAFRLWKKSGKIEEPRKVL